MYDDTHCHLSFPGLHGRIDSVQADMAAAGVDRALCICTTLEEFDTVHGLAMAHPNLWATVGVHPDNEGVAEPDTATLVALSRRPRVVAIGETGLDYFRLGTRTHADMAWQRTRFRAHIRAARQTGLPLVVHTRAASADTLAILREEGAGDQGPPGSPPLRGVFHCFTETQAVADAALALGFHISFSGILTFRNAQDIRDVALHVPLERCLVETDSPYLAPMPHRGKTNSPAHVPLVAAALAAVKGLPLDDVAPVLRRNFEALFGLPAWQGASPLALASPANSATPGAVFT